MNDSGFRALTVFSNRRGNVAIVVALTLPILIGMLAFTLDVGYLYGEKNRIQNAVDAAAMAGAANLCSGDRDYIETLVKNIAEDNGLSETDRRLTVDFGFYDEMEAYTNFNIYKDFVVEKSMPSGEYVNAVLVSYQGENVTLTGFYPKTTVNGKSVAYLKSYGILSLGEEEGDGITFRSFNDGQPIIDNGDIFANKTVNFEGTDPTLGEDVNIVEYASVSMKPVSAYLEDFRARADKIITLDDFPESVGEEQTDEEGNVYTRTGFGSPPTFCPFIGNHEGTIYYCESGSVDVQLGNPPDPGENAEITNLTFVSEAGIVWRGNQKVNWGGENEKQVTIIAGGDINFGGMFRSDGYFDAKGVVFRAGEDIIWKMSSSHSDHDSLTRTLRMIADGKIDIQGPGFWFPVSVGFNLKFGPPCPPCDIRLGRLVTP